MGSAEQVASLSPRVRNVFLAAAPAVLSWDINAHRHLEDAVVNNKWIQHDVDPDNIFGERFAAFIIALILDLMPGVFLFEGLKAEEKDYKFILGTIAVIVAITTVVFLHRKIKISRMRRQGAKWRSNINKLIELTKGLSEQERQELYAVMLEKGIEVRQHKASIEMMRNAEDAEDLDWWLYWSGNH